MDGILFTSLRSGGESPPLIVSNTFLVSKTCHITTPLHRHSMQSLLLTWFSADHLQSLVHGAVGRTPFFALSVHVLTIGLCLVVACVCGLLVTWVGI